MNEQLLNDARIFAQHIVIAIDCLDQSNAMDKIFRNPEHSKQYKAAPHFYKTAFHAMRYRFDMEVAKLFDQDSRSFDSFKNTLARERVVDKLPLEKYKKMKNELKTDLENIKDRRNKIHAHSDTAYFDTPDEFVNDHPVDRDRVKELLHVMLHICNGVVHRGTKEGISQLYGTGNSDDFVRLFGYETEFDNYCKSFGK